MFFRCIEVFQFIGFDRVYSLNVQGSRVLAYGFQNGEDPSEPYYAC